MTLLGQVSLQLSCVSLCSEVCSVCKITRCIFVCMNISSLCMILVVTDDGVVPQPYPTDPNATLGSAMWTAFNISMK